MWKRDVVIGVFALLLTFSAGATAVTPQLWVLEGHFVPGGYALGLTDSGTNVWLDDQALWVDDHGWFVIGFAWNTPLERTLKLVSEGGDEQRYPIVMKSRTFKSKKVNGVPSASVRPNPEQQRRIARESRRMQDLRAAHPTATDNLLKPWQAPIKGRVSSGFGEHRVYNNELMGRHYGQDIVAVTGAPVGAVRAGTVVVADDLYLSGGTVVLDHGSGLLSSYLHLERLDVAEGDWVQAGHVIGRVGSTGRSTGPHLDWRVSWFDVRLDPALFLVPRTSLPGFLSP